MTILVILGSMIGAASLVAAVAWKHRSSKNAGLIQLGVNESNQKNEFFNRLLDDRKRR